MSQWFGSVTHAQHGDDLFILNLFTLMGIEKPSYLDIGAFDPTIISNTKLLYDRGSRGVNVEANPKLYDRFVEQRPEDTNLLIGVAPVEGNKIFYMYSDDHGRNTFCEKEMLDYSKTEKVWQEVERYCVTIMDIVYKYCGGMFPNLLSIDIEGLDYDVLSTIPYDIIPMAQPMVICVETRREDTLKMSDMLFNKGFYRLTRLGANLIFIRKDMYERAF